MFPYHFIGYWGDKSKEFLTQRRRGAKRRSEEEKFFWDVVYIGCESLPVLPKNTIAGISAGGFSVLDVWVKITNNRLILGREIFGKVPLFWTQQGGVVWFSSQLQLLLEILEKPQVSIYGLYGYSCFSYVPNPLTPINEVFSVTAGTEMIFNGVGDPQVDNIYQWYESKEQIKDENTAVSQLQILLKNAIQTQISDLKDQPVGVFLSGGLDSS
ncbi:MAG: asparagine synthase-related protein, partial [Dolichospermum sp.]